jgi:hypothetical protein
MLSSKRKGGFPEGSKFWATMLSFGTRRSTFMGSVKPILVCVVAIALSVAVECIGTSLQRLSAQSQKAPGKMYSSKRWQTANTG